MAYLKEKEALGVVWEVVDTVSEERGDYRAAMWRTHSESFRQVQQPEIMQWLRFASPGDVVGWYVHHLWRVCPIEGDGAVRVILEVRDSAERIVSKTDKLTVKEVING
jgi:hypothetical protein